MTFEVMLHWPFCLQACKNKRILLRISTIESIFFTLHCNPMKTPGESVKYA